MHYSCSETKTCFSKEDCTFKNLSCYPDSIKTIVLISLRHDTMVSLLEIFLYAGEIYPFILPSATISKDSTD